MNKKIIGKNELEFVLNALVYLGEKYDDTSFLKTFVLVGGSALCFQDVRALSADIDFFTEYSVKKYNIFDEVKQMFFERFGEKLEIDTTNSNFIWGQISIGDINKRPVAREIRGEKGLYEIKMLDPESLFIVKTEAMRDQDIEDLKILKNHTTKPKILNRFNELLPYNDINTMSTIAENLLGELQIQYFEPITKKDIDLLEIPDYFLDQMKESFGLDSLQDDEKMV